MNSRPIILLLAGALMTGAFGQAAAARLETLHGITLGEKTATIRVTSNGCTAPEDFRVAWSVAEDGENAILRLRILRLRPDRCRARPRPVELELPIPRWTGTPIFIDNPFRFPHPLSHADPIR